MYDTKTAIKELETRINVWYKNAEMDYGVTGHFVSAKRDEEVPSILTIKWVEDNEDYTFDISYYSDYTPDDLYNIWMTASAYYA